MRLNLYAALAHYAEHMWPIWEALPEEVRGATWSPRHDAVDDGGGFDPTDDAVRQLLTDLGLL